MKSIQLHDSIEGLSQKIVFITLHYITLHRQVGEGAEETQESNQDGEYSYEDRLRILGLTTLETLWQPPNHYHLLLQIFGMHCQIICRPFQLFLLF